MTTPWIADVRGGSSVFLVERYLTAAAAQGLPAAIARTARLAALTAVSAPGREAQYVLSAYLPAEDTCFCLFRAATEEAVRALNDEASFALDRINAAVLLYPPADRLTGN
jgi:hypothetical protein